MINFKIFTQTVMWSLTKRCTVYTRENQHLETIWPFQEYLQLDLSPWPSRLAQVHLLPRRKWKCPRLVNLVLLNLNSTDFSTLQCQYIYCTILNRLVNLVLLHWLQPMQSLPHRTIVPSQSIYVYCTVLHWQASDFESLQSKHISDSVSTHILHWCTHKSIWSLCRGLWHCRYCHVSLL